MYDTQLLLSWSADSDEVYLTSTPTWHRTMSVNNVWPTDNVREYRWGRRSAPSSTARGDQVATVMTLKFVSRKAKHRSQELEGALVKCPSTNSDQNRGSSYHCPCRRSRTCTSRCADLPELTAETFYLTERWPKMLPRIPGYLCELSQVEDWIHGRVTSS